MKKYFLLVLACLCCVGFRSCESNTHGGDVSSTSQLSTEDVRKAVEEAFKANHGVDAAEKERVSKVKTLVVSAKTANEDNPDGIPKETVDKELGAAEDLMTDVVEDPQRLIAAAERREAIAQGNTEKVEQMYGILKTEAAKDKEALAALRKEVEIKEGAWENQLAVFNDELLKEQQKAIKAMAAASLKVAQAQDDARRKVQAETSRYLNLIGAGFIVAAVVLAVISVQSLSGLTIGRGLACAILAGSGGACFAMVSFINHPWIPKATAACIVLIVGVASFILVKDFRTQKKKAIETRASFETDIQVKSTALASLEDLAVKFVDTVESLPEEQTSVLRQQLAEIFPLGSEGNKLIAKLKAMRPSKLLK